MDSLRIPPSLSVLAPAKLNLFLHINGRREDGYHELQSLFQPVDLFDTLRFEHEACSTRQPDDVAIHLRLDPSSPVSLPAEASEHDKRSNLAFRAAELLRQHQIRMKGEDPLANAELHITLTKVIPVGAGLGGGSSDAASTLLTLNRLWNLKLPLKNLCSLGLQLGADVPFFLYQSACLAEGIGEVLTPLKLAQEHFLLIHPGCHISTPAIFGHQALTRDTPKRKIAPALRDELTASLSPLWSSKMFGNDCETVVRFQHPEVNDIFDWASAEGQTCRLTGTGSTVFIPCGPVANPESASLANRLAQKLPSAYNSRLVSGLTSGSHKL
ncbi:4-(cytidine 5'-diphospho)-2-C-methyl-D-erythritol kinase [Allohahella marinimesophila]|uniref:4-diphosphocytidyl-2-C-methyl-D-erythritol kinase n=1 Tax=Allohahella marinimesophila TaxID=1054972 RepID=A0ABP7Q6V6_9GAMM